jgi:hypothetical protein
VGRNSTFRLFCFSTLCILATIGSLGTARSQSARIVGEAGDWIAVESAGVTAYATRGSSDSRVEIRCDVARTDDFSATGIAVELNGLVAPSNADVRFDVDGEVITFKFAPAGSPSFSDCPDCAARFDALWRRIRAGSRLMVTYSDGTTATFSLRGTARLLPTEPCPTATAAPQSVAAPPASEFTSHTAAGDRYATVAPAPLPELERVALAAPQPCGVIAPDTRALIARGGDSRPDRHDDPQRPEHRPRFPLSGHERC